MYSFVDEALNYREKEKYSITVYDAMIKILKLNQPEIARLQDIALMENLGPYNYQVLAFNVKDVVRSCERTIKTIIALCASSEDLSRYVQSYPDTPGYIKSEIGKLIQLRMVMKTS